MVRFIGALVLVLLLVSPSLGQQSLVGTYKLVSHTSEVDGSPTKTMGNPHGYLVLTPTRAIAIYTSENRRFGTSVAEKAALLDTLVAWSASYRVEGDKFIYTDDVSWTENMNGRTVVSTYQLSGNRLTLMIGPIPFPVDPSKTMILRTVWDKIE
jgi:hypothetical protein